MRKTNNIFFCMIALLAIMTLGGSLPIAIGAPATMIAAVSWGMLHASMTMNVTRDLVNNIGVGVSFYPQVVTADAAASVGIDTRGFESVAFVQVAGAIVAAGLAKLVPVECDTLGGSYTDVAAGDLDGAFTNAAANTTQKVGYRGNKDFVGLRADYLSGTSVILGGLVIEGDPAIRKVA